MTGLYYTILAEGRHAEIAIVRKGKVKRQRAQTRLDNPARLVVADDVKSSCLEDLKANAELLKRMSGIDGILYATRMDDGEPYLEVISQAEFPHTQPFAPLALDVSSRDIENYQRQSEGAIASFSNDPSFYYYVSPETVEAQPFTSANFYSIFSRDRGVELVIRHNDTIVRQEPRMAWPDMKIKLVVVDKNVSDDTIGSLLRHSNGLRQRQGVHQIMYLARTPRGAVYSQIIPAHVEA